MRNPSYLLFPAANRVPVEGTDSSSVPDPGATSFGWPQLFLHGLVPNDVMRSLLKLAGFQWQWNEVTFRQIGFLRIVDVG